MGDVGICKVEIRSTEGYYVFEEGANVQGESVGFIRMLKGLSGQVGRSLNRHI